MFNARKLHNQVFNAKDVTHYSMFIIYTCKIKYALLINNALGEEKVLSSMWVLC